MSELSTNRCTSGRTGRHKRLYDTRKLALYAAGQVQRKLGRPMDVYHCMECHGWHMANGR